jgi:outer membrane protein assembly factor BamB
VKRPELASIAGFAGLLFSGLGCDQVSTGASPEVPLWTHRPSYSMSIAYQRPLVAGTRRSGEPYERGQPALDPAHGRVFVGSSDRGLYALRAVDGEVLWRFETVGAVQSEPLYDPVEDALYFGSNDGALYKLRASDGGLLWRFMSNAEVSKQPVLAGGVLYFVNANDTVLAVDPRTGERRWSQHRAPALGMEIAGHSGPLVHAGKVFLCFSDGSVGAYDAATGNEAWEPLDLSLDAEQLLGAVPKYLDVDSTPGDSRRSASNRRGELRGRRLCARGRKRQPNLVQQRTPWRDGRRLVARARTRWS